MTMKLFTTAALMLALGACSGGEDKKADTKPVEAALPPGRPAIYAAAAKGPEDFVRAIYAVYVAGGPKEPAPAPGRDPIYSRMLNATVGADVRVANGEVPTLNYDLICACQDQGAFTLDNLTIGQSEPRAATAAVVFTNAGKTTSQTLKLVKEGSIWKVDDIVGSDGKSIKEETIKVIEAAGG